MTALFASILTWEIVLVRAHIELVSGKGRVVLSTLWRPRSHCITANCFISLDLEMGLSAFVRIHTRSVKRPLISGATGCIFWQAQTRRLQRFCSSKVLLVWLVIYHRPSNRGMSELDDWEKNRWFYHRLRMDFQRVSRTETIITHKCINQEITNINCVSVK